MLLAILDFARIASALVVVVGVTSHKQRVSVIAKNRSLPVTLGAELLLVLEDVGLRAWVLAIAQRCYDCEECCSQSFDF